MIKTGSIINILVMIPILTLVVYIGDLRCQENSHNINAEYRSVYVEKSVSATQENDMKDDKNIGVEILEWMIKRNLNYKYSRLEPEELEEMLEKRR